MARPLRITYPGAFYHVTARGNGRKNEIISNQKSDRNIPTLKRLASHHNVGYLPNR